MVETSILTDAGVLVADVTWASTPFSERVEVFGREGLLDSSTYSVSLKEIFLK